MLLTGAGVDRAYIQTGKDSTTKEINMRAECRRWAHSLEARAAMHSLHVSLGAGDE